MNIAKLNQNPGIPFQTADIQNEAAQSTPEITGDVQRLLEKTGLADYPMDMPKAIADDLMLASQFRHDMPSAEIATLFRRLAGEYGQTGAVTQSQVKQAMIFAEPFILKQGDGMTESDMQDALEKGVRICLLSQWLQANEGLREFPATLRAIAQEGQLPGTQQEDLRGLSIVRG